MLFPIPIYPVEMAIVLPAEGTFAANQSCPLPIECQSQSLTTKLMGKVPTGQITVQDETSPVFSRKSLWIASDVSGKTEGAAPALNPAERESPINSPAPDDTIDLPPNPLEFSSDEASAKQSGNPLSEPPAKSPTVSGAPQEPAASLNETELFEQVFGRPSRTQTASVRVPLIMDGRSAGTILVHPQREGSEVEIEGHSLLTLVKNTLTEAVQTALQAQINHNGRLSLIDLQSHGVDAHFDPRQLELQINIPPDLRANSISHLGPPETIPQDTELAPPGKFSGYLNLRGSQAVTWTGDAADVGFNPLSIELDGALNWQGWVLEAQAQAAWGQPWQWGGLSIVRDAPQQALRYTLGDLTVPAVGYQSSASLLGFSAVRNFSLQPFRVARPTGNYSFFLERPATVDVFVNDAPTATLQLDAGPQDIRDLPLQTGINDIRLKITDDSGQVQQLNFSTGVAGELLAPGTHQFAYSLGFTTLEGKVVKAYDLEHPIISMFYRVGFNSHLTAGGYFQGDGVQQLLGVNGTWATSAGNFGWDLAASRDAAYGVDVAGKLLYDWLQASSASSQPRQLRLALEYRGDHFLSLGEREPQNQTAWNVSLAYQQTIFDNIRASFNGQYQINRQEDDAYILGLSLSRPLRQGLNLSIGYHYNRDATGQADQRFSIGLNGSLPFRGQTFSSRTDISNTEAPTRSLNWSYSPRHVLGSLRPSLTLNQAPERYSAQARLQYQGYRSTLGLNHQLTLPRTEGRPVENRSVFTWGTAVAFVDGVWGWSRPIDNSFALIARQGVAREQIVRVNPSTFGDRAQANDSGPAVLPLTPYALASLTLNAPDLPIGRDLGTTRHQVLPSYRSGVLIRTGTEATVFLRGVLVDRAQQPVSLKQGQVRSLSDPNWPTIDFFTNRTGRFALFGFKPGRYQLQVSGIEAATLEFEISEQQQGQYNIGSLQLPVLLERK